MNYLLVNNTSCSPKQKSTVILLYKKLKSLSFRRLQANFPPTLLHKPCDIATLCHRLCGISWSDVTIYATLWRYVTNNATLSTVDLTSLASRPMKWLIFVSYIIQSFICWIFWMRLNENKIKILSLKYLMVQFPLRFLINETISILILLICFFLMVMSSILLKFQWAGLQ